MPTITLNSCEQGIYQRRDFDRIQQENRQTINKEEVHSATTFNFTLHTLEKFKTQMTPTYKHKLAGGREIKFAAQLFVFEELQALYKFFVSSVTEILKRNITCIAE